MYIYARLAEWFRHLSAKQIHAGSYPAPSSKKKKDGVKWGKKKKEK